jgi:integrator complex subunit 2
MPALAITLSLDHAGRTLGADADGDMVAFVSGLLLGNDQQVRNWFAMFVRNGQKVCELHSKCLVHFKKLGVFLYSAF